MNTKTHIHSSVVLAALVLVSFAAALVLAPRVHSEPSAATRVVTIRYTAHDGSERAATVLLPGWYGPRRNPPIPLVIAPHGRGCDGKTNAEYWADLPGRGGFAVVNPDGMGRHLGNYSYGFAGQIDDLARMPELARHALPWLRIDRRRIYALGSSMGGQETLLLVARHPRLLAGAIAMDSVTDLAKRYGELLNVACDANCVRRFGTTYGRILQKAMSREVGGTPAQARAAYAARSPMHLARSIAFSNVPLEIWWSRNDRIVTNQRGQSGRLYTTLKRLNPRAPIVGYEGAWKHSAEMRADALLPTALTSFRLLPRRYAAAVAAGLPATMRLPAPCAD